MYSQGCSVTRPALHAPLRQSPMLLQRTTSEPDILYLLRNVFVSIFIGAPPVSGESSSGYWSCWLKNPVTIKAGFEDLWKVSLILFAVIDLVWPGCPDRLAPKKNRDVVSKENAAEPRLLHALPHS